VRPKPGFRQCGNMKPRCGNLKLREFILFTTLEKARDP
jgi:hypothetical protein